jgi:hypothetical protein
MVVHPCSPSTWATEAGESPDRGQPGLQSEFEASLNYI